jgi:hypothetical protein
VSKSGHLIAALRAEPFRMALFTILYIAVFSRRFSVLRKS